MYLIIIIFIIFQHHLKTNEILFGITILSVVNYAAKMSTIPHLSKKKKKITHFIVYSIESTTKDLVQFLSPLDIPMPLTLISTFQNIQTLRLLS